MIGRYSGISAGNWAFDNAVTDASGNSNNGTATDITYGLGRFGDCAIFDGDSSSIKLPNNASLKPTIFTIMCWFKGGSVATNGTVFQDSAIPSSVIYGYLFRIVSTGVVLLRIAKGTGNTAGTDYQTCSSTTVVNDNVWHFIAGTYDGSVIQVYVDGHFEASTNWTGLVYTSTQYPDIGVREDSSASYSDYLTGSLDSLVLLPYVLSDSDIRRQYAWGKGML